MNKNQVHSAKLLNWEFKKKYYHILSENGKFCANHFERKQDRDKRIYIKIKKEK